jgi:hypothetical protein
MPGSASGPGVLRIFIPPLQLHVRAGAHTAGGLTNLTAAAVAAAGGLTNVTAAQVVGAGGLTNVSAAQVLAAGALTNVSGAAIVAAGGLTNVTGAAILAAGALTNVTAAAVLAAGALTNVTGAAIVAGGGVTGVTVNGTAGTLSGGIVALTVEAGGSAAVVRYVATNGAHQTPFLSWGTAASNIQSAVDVALAGETVLVSNGVYGTGVRALGGETNRVVVTNAVTVRSLNGPLKTTIAGAMGVRGVYMGGSAWLAGFTVRDAGYPLWWGGGVKGGSVSNCIFLGNNAAAGGGVYTSTVYACTFDGNSAGSGGAGIYSKFYNCLVINNAGDSGGAGVACTFYNCTLADNGGDSGQADSGKLYGCIMVGNVNDSDTSSTMYYSLYPGGSGTSIDSGATPPLFVNEAGGDYRLRKNSPGVERGSNGTWTVGAVDLDGVGRVYPARGSVDMGCYEWVGDLEAVHVGDPTVGLGTVGHFMIRNGNQLVFVAGTVTNVLDGDVGTP